MCTCVTVFLYRTKQTPFGSVYSALTLMFVSMSNISNFQHSAHTCKLALHTIKWHKLGLIQVTHDRRKDALVRSAFSLLLAILLGFPLPMHQGRAAGSPQQFIERNKKNANRKTKIANGAAGSRRESTEKTDQRIYDLLKCVHCICTSPRRSNM